MQGAEVVIVGGGIVGSAAAMFLAEAGVDVMVVERGRVSGEASGVNAGMIDAPGDGGVSELDGLLKMGSLEIFRSMHHDRGLDIGFQQNGQLVLIASEAEWEWASSLPRGSGVELLDREALTAIEPAAGPRAVGALYSAGAGCAEPEWSTVAFADAARAAGARIVTAAEVTAVAASTLGYRLETDAGRVEADALVVAAGAWCRGLGSQLGLDIPVSPVRGQMWATAPLPPSLQGTVAGLESAHHWSSHETHPPQVSHVDGVRVTRHLYGRQRANGEVIFGGDRVPTDVRDVDADGIASNHDHASQLLPFLRGHRPVRSWSGLMPFSDDGLPLIGPITERPGVFVGAGLASSGFGRGPMTGRLVADAVLGKALPEAAGAAHPAGRVGEISR